VWKRTPIAITLPVGKERFVTFPSEVQFGYNSELLPPSILRVENDNRTLYLLAKKPFATQRVEAKLANGDIILLDISAKKEASNNPIDIVLPKRSGSLNNESAGNNNVSSASVNYVTLTRYAVQQLYAPRRLLKVSMSITRFPMDTMHVVPLFYDDSAVAMPLASWRGGNLYVTALLIKNQLHQSLRLDSRLLCGNWKAASFYPQTTLLPKGTPINRDTSTLFVVSNRPFSQAIQSCLSQN
jgi:integrating conjugative element protein (TIGR03749 family)